MIADFASAFGEKTRPGLETWRNSSQTTAGGEFIRRKSCGKRDTLRRKKPRFALAAQPRPRTRRKKGIALRLTPRLDGST